MSKMMNFRQATRNQGNPFIIIQIDNVIKNDYSKYSSCCLQKGCLQRRSLSKKITVIKNDNQSLPIKGHTKDIITKDNNIILTRLAYRPQLPPILSLRLAPKTYNMTTRIEPYDRNC